MKILIADDSAVIRIILKQVFIDMNVAESDIFQASNGREALKLFEGHEDLELVILDWDMPEVDGLECLKQMRDQNTGLPIIMLTSHSQKSHIVRAVAGGVTDYIRKPFNRESLAEKIKPYVTGQTDALDDIL